MTSDTDRVGGQAARLPSRPAVDPARWLLRRLPVDAAGALFCFPYSGVGASSFREWPKELAGLHVVPIQPPGRENRIREQALTTHQEFAASFAEALHLLDGRPFAFFGHCGAVLYLLEVIRLLEERDEPLPMWVMSSSWGGPQLGLHGDINYVDLETYDFRREVLAMAGRQGAVMEPVVADMAAALLKFDATVHRGYSYPDGWRVPVPVTAVAWTEDDMIPPETALAGWDVVADVEPVTLDGSHTAYQNCPADLRAAIVATQERWGAGTMKRPNAKEA